MSGVHQAQVPLSIEQEDRRDSGLVWAFWREGTTVANNMKYA